MARASLADYLQEFLKRGNEPGYIPNRLTITNQEAVVGGDHRGKKKIEYRKDKTLLDETAKGHRVAV
jgi:hypothetical protein